MANVFGLLQCKRMFVGIALFTLFHPCVLVGAVLVSGHQLMLPPTEGIEQGAN